MKRTAFRPALRLPAAVLALGLLAGCTAGLGEQPTVTDEPIAATDEDSLPALLANTPTEDVEFYWPNQGSATLPLQEPEPPQMDKQTAANNAAAAFSAAGVLPESGSLLLGLASTADMDQETNAVTVLFGRMQDLWPAADEVYFAGYDVADPEATAEGIFDAITGKAYLLGGGDYGYEYGPMPERYAELFDCPTDGGTPPDDPGEAAAESGAQDGGQPDPRYAQAAADANAWVEQVKADPAAFLNRLMPLLGWQAASVESCGAYAPWPEAFDDFYRQAVVNGQYWPYMLDIRFTTTDGSRWIGIWDPMIRQLRMLCCLGTAGRVPEGYRGDPSSGGVICLTEGQPVFGPCYNYVLQGGDGIWREVTCMDEAGWQTLWAEQSFSAEKYLDILYWYDPTAEQTGPYGPYRPLSDGFPAWDPAGQPAQMVEEVDGALEQAAQP